MNKILTTVVLMLVLAPSIALSMQTPSKQDASPLPTKQATAQDEHQPDKDQDGEPQSPTDSLSSEEDEVDKAEQLVQNIELRVNQLQKHLDDIVATTPAEEIKNLAIILDMDDTCLCSPEAYELLIQNPESPLYDDAEEGKEYWPYPITPVLFLFNWAIDEGFKIFFLTARPERHPLCPEVDITHLHKQQIANASFGEIDDENEYLICMPLEKYQEAVDPKNQDSLNALIGAWKHSQHDVIEKKYGCKIVAVLDDQPENLDRAKPGHLRIPSPRDPHVTPQKPKSVSRISR